MNENITQCYWHANGELECKNISVNTKQETKSYVEFNTFSNPNMNYNPNAYHENYNYYQQPAKNCCFNQNNNSGLPGNNNYIAPPKTFTRVRYLSGDASDKLKQ